MGKVLVVGASGFIGNHVCKKLLAAGENIVALSRNSAYPFKINGENFLNVIGDYRDVTILDAILPSCDVVIFLASSGFAHSRSLEFSSDVSQAIFPLLQLLERMVAHGVRRIVYASSGGAIYGIPHYVPIDEVHPVEPLSSYGILKLTSEHYLKLYKKLYGLQCLSLRISNPYGPGQFPGKGQGVVPTFMHCAMNNSPVQLMGDGSATRDYIYIDDVADAFVLSAQSDFSGVVNISSGSGVSLNQLLGLIEEVSKCKLRFNVCEEQNFAPKLNFLDNKLARDILLWAPKTSIHLGLNLTWEWLTRENG